MPLPAAVSSYPGRLAVPTSVRSAGYVPFIWHPLTYSRHTNLGETGERGSTETVNVSVAWEDLDVFQIYAHGRTQAVNDGGWSGYGLTRTLPLQSPFNADNLLTDSVLVAATEPRTDPPEVIDGVTQPDSPAVSYSFAFQFATLRLEFESRSYILQEDVTVPLNDGGSPPARVGELCRYVTRYPMPNARERKVSNGQLMTKEDSVTIAEPGFLIDRGGSLTMVWHQVPVEYIPWTAIGECSGRCNAGKFDPYTGGAFGNVRAVDIPAERAVFRGLAEAPAPYKGWDGQSYVDLKYNFLIRLPGATPAPFATPPPSTVPANPTWNQYAKVLADTTLKIYTLVWKTTSGTPRKVYETCDMDTLFRAEA